MGFKYQLLQLGPDRDDPSPGNKSFEESLNSKELQDPWETGSCGWLKMVAYHISHSRMFKYLLLLTLTLNTSFTVLLLRASKFSVGNDGRIYQSSTAIFMAEAVKFLTCFSVLIWNEGKYLLLMLSLQKSAHACIVDIFGLNTESNNCIIQGLMPSFCHFYSEVILKWRETSKLLIPASLYMVQNNLLFIAVQYVDPATYQVSNPISSPLVHRSLDAGSRETDLPRRVSLPVWLVDCSSMPWPCYKHHYP